MSYKDFALTQAKMEDITVELIVCPNTQKELYYVSDEGRLYPVDSFGTCVSCDLDLHISELKILDSSSPWPIQYAGLFCKKCYYEDSTLQITDKENLKPEKIDE